MAFAWLPCRPDVTPPPSPPPDKKAHIQTPCVHITQGADMLTPCLSVLREDTKSQIAPGALQCVSTPMYDHRS